MGFTKAALASSLLLLGQQAAASMEPIVMKGSKLFYENGTQFFIRGVAYQADSSAGGTSSDSTYVDPLATESTCARDIPYLQKLGTNVIRTYAINPTADHSACMSLLQKAGIYVISDLSSPDESINRDQPQWNTDLYNRYSSVIDELAKYDNVIGFFAGNEVSNNASNTQAAAFVKAAVRDMKTYIKEKGYRWMGVGYAANDDVDIRSYIAHYFNCGEQDDAIDWWGYNIYSWCGDSSMQKSGYDTEVEFFSNYSAPVFFAEYGCNTVAGAAGRLWEETTALYSDSMSNVFSGGIVYEYFEETNDYGIVSIANDKVSVMKDYTSLSSRLAAATPSGTHSADYSPTNSPAACPTVGSAWAASSNLPPTPNMTVCECMYNSLGCVPASGLATKDYGDIFNYICTKSPKSCVGISANGTSGVYGAYSMCNATHQLGYVLDAYYQAQNKDSSACDFNGQAQTTSASGKSASCSTLLASASSINAAVATGTGSSSSSTASSSSHSNAAMPVSMKSLFSIGDMAVGLYVLVAMGAGAGMVLL